MSKSLSAFFQDAVCAATDEERLLRMQEVIQQLPAPHYRSENSCTSAGAADGCSCTVLGLGAAAWHLGKLDLLPIP